MFLEMIATATLNPVMSDPSSDRQPYNHCKYAKSGYYKIVITATGEIFVILLSDRHPGSIDRTQSS
jgi:hypothetical protein